MSNYCASCGNELPEEMDFCPQCGAKIDLDPEQPETLKMKSVPPSMMKDQPEREEEPALREGHQGKGKRTVLAVLGALILLLLIVGGLLLWTWSKEAHALDLLDADIDQIIGRTVEIKAEDTEAPSIDNKIQTLRKAAEARSERLSHQRWYLLSKRVARLERRLESIVIRLNHEEKRVVFYRCQARNSNLRAEAMALAVKCSMQIAAVEKCNAAVAEARAKRTLGGVAGGALLGCAIGVWFGPPGWAACGAGLGMGATAGGGAGFFSSGKKCPLPPTCRPDEKKNLLTILKQEGLSALPRCHDPGPPPSFLVNPPAEDGAGRDLAKLEIRVTKAEKETAQIARRVQRLEKQYRIAGSRFLNAKNQFEQARSKGKAAVEQFNQVAEQYVRAQVQLRVATYALLAATAISAGKLTCMGKQSTAKFRALLKKEGLDLRGKDIDHIIPRSRKGADHPLNHQIWDATKNRSCGNGCLIEKFSGKPVESVLGLGASLLGLVGGC